MNEGRKRALIYSRVSRDDSGEGKSNERQEADCQKLADLRGWQVVGVERDVSISAYSGKERPGWNRVLEAIRSGSVDVVIAWHMDRMTRSMLDLEELIVLSEGSDVGIVTVTGDIDLTNDVGRMVARILAAVARAEVERKSERQKLANQQRAAQGSPWQSGFRAFGYELDGTLKPHEADHIKQAAADALAGVSMREIARQWVALGLRSTHANDKKDGWTGRGIKNMLTNPRYAGIATYRGERVGKGMWEPILTEETHAELVAKLTDPKRRTNKATAGRTPKYLLSTLAVCGKCGLHVGGRMSNGNPAYACQPANHTSTKRDLADEYVLTVFEAAVKVLGPMQLPLGADPVAAAEHGDELEEIASLAERRKLLTDAMIRGDIAGDQFEQGLASIRAREDALGASLRGDQPMLRTVTHGADAYLEEFLSAPIAAQRDSLARVLDITLHPIGQGRRNVPIDEQVEIFVKHVSGQKIPASAVLKGEE